MDSKGHTHATETDPRSVPDGDGAASDTAGDGSSPAAAFRESLRHFAELREYAAYYIATRLDTLRLGIRNLIVLIALGIIGLIAAGAMIVTSVVMILRGVAGALAEILPLWAADLIIGVVFLLVVGAIVYIGVSRLTRTSRLQTVEKYERRKHDQQTRFGHDVNDRA